LERNEDLDALAAKVREARDRYNEIERKNNEKNREDFYCVVVFRDSAQLTAFLKAVGLPDNRFQSGEQLATICGVFDKLKESAAAADTDPDHA
jgi:hypothetical protein